MADSPVYVCPFHRSTLKIKGGSARCPRCDASYAIENEIWILDTVHRADRLAFDEQVEASPIPLDKSKAERHMQAAGIGRLHRARILDAGCGLGDMAYGLACHPHIKSSDIYAFDHSIASVRQAMSNVGQPANGNRVYFSTQDASSLFFGDSSFDLVAGSAVLHHITDYRLFLRQIFRILKRDGVAIFSEPFFEGYFWPCFLLHLAAQELHLESLAGPEFGMADFMLKDTAYRVQNADDVAALDPLTDKHYFRAEILSSLAAELGFRGVRFQNVEPARFYDCWMPHFLDVYQIQHEPLRRKAMQLYDELRSYAGPALPAIAPHFRYIVLQK